MKFFILISTAVLTGCSYLHVKDGKLEGKAIDASQRVGEELNRSGKKLGKKLRSENGEKLICVKKEDCPEKKNK